jgi:hypothetical protein
MILEKRRTIPGWIKRINITGQRGGDENACINHRYG